MNKKQKELYEKSLKKVKEHCLGATAEKEITALEALKELKFQVGNIRAGTHDNPPQISSRLVRDMGLFEIIETALREYKELKSAFTLTNHNGEYYIVVYKKDFEEDCKKLKAFEIIKNKGISTCSVAINYEDFERYSKSCFRNYNPLTKEQYDFLKEALKDE